MRRMGIGKVGQLVPTPDNIVQYYSGYAAPETGPYPWQSSLSGM